MSKKILVLAYAISPSKGSEYSVAWNYIKYMSTENQLTVLYGMSGEHMGEIQEIEEFLNNNQLENTRLVPIKPNKKAKALNWFNRHGILAYTFYWAYTEWHKLAYEKAKKLLELEKFDLIHYVGPIGYREPGFLWKLDLPYIWGPIGGTTNINPILIDSLNLAGKIKLGTRAILNNIQLRFSSRVKKALKSSDLVLSATSENKDRIKLFFGIDSVYNPENAIDNIMPLNKIKFKDDELINLIFVGSLDSRKSVITILEALVKVKLKEKIKLHIVGDGPLKNSLMKFSKKNNLTDIIQWYGNIDRKCVSELMNNSHLHLITSVSEGNPTTIWEAMSVGLPTLSLNHCGMKDTINENNGFLVEITSLDQITTEIAKIIDLCVTDRQILKEKAKAVITYRTKYLWIERVKFISECYDKAIHNFNSKKNIL